MTGKPFVRMTPDDVAAVAKLDAGLQRFPWTPGNFRDALAAGYDGWLKRQANRLVSFAVAMPAVDETHLLVIGVDRAWQRRGEGRVLLEFLCAAARDAGMQRLLLEVRPSNDAALAFYNRTGFSEIGRRRGYYPAAPDMGGREDAIVMARTL